MPARPATDQLWSPQVPINRRALNLSGVATVLLPGTGSDDDYIRRAFAGPCTTPGPSCWRNASAVPACRLSRPLTPPGSTVRSRSAGSPSGAAVASTNWALASRRAPSRCWPLPPWTGEPDSAPAALSARHTAPRCARRPDGHHRGDASRQAGVAGRRAGSLMARSSGPNCPTPWRSRHGAAPRTAELAPRRAGAVDVAAPDDFVHPLKVALEWVSAAPHAALRTVTLAEFGLTGAAWARQRAWRFCGRRRPLTVSRRCWNCAAA